MQELTNILRKPLGVAVGQGALVVIVRPGTPAEKAGIQAGDVIVEFAGKPVTDRSQLQGIVEALEVGEKYPAEVLRDGKRVALQVTLEEMPGDFTPALRRAIRREQPPEKDTAAKFSELGLEIDKLTPQVLEQLGLREQAGKIAGVLVRKVQPGSPAAGAGLQPGDIVEKVGTRRVTTPAEFDEATKDLSVKDGILLLVRRGNSTQFVVVRSDE